MDTSGGSMVPCVLFALKSLLTLLAIMQCPACKQGGDAVIRHNQLRDVFAEARRRAHFPVRIEIPLCYYKATLVNNNI